jgi:CheY-like chemotaxis protein
VLIVEDSFPVANAMQALLEGIGMVILGPVATTAGAERLLAEEPAPQIALVDLHLRSGETAHDLIGRLHDASIPVVIISGLATLPSSTGIVAVLQKPFSGPELLATLSKLLASAPILG